MQTGAGLFYVGIWDIMVYLVLRKQRHYLYLIEELKMIGENILIVNSY